MFCTLPVSLAPRYFIQVKSTPITADAAQGKTGTTKARYSPAARR